MDEYPSEWVVLPGAELELEFRAEVDLRVHQPPGPAIFIMGNRYGLVSLGNALLWMAQGGDNFETLSITGLPYARARGSLSLSVWTDLRGAEPEDRVVRVDGASQYEWRIDDESLEELAVAVLNVGYTPQDYCPDHCHAAEGSDSEIELIFGRS